MRLMESPPRHRVGKLLRPRRGSRERPFDTASFTPTINLRDEKCMRGRKGGCYNTHTNTHKHKHFKLEYLHVSIARTVPLLTPFTYFCNQLLHLRFGKLGELRYTLPQCLDSYFLNKASLFFPHLFGSVNMSFLSVQKHFKNTVLLYLTGYSALARHSTMLVSKN